MRKDEDGLDERLKKRGEVSLEKCNRKMPSAFQ